MAIAMNSKYPRRYAIFTSTGAVSSAVVLTLVVALAVSGCGRSSSDAANRVAANYLADRAKCDPLSGNARDVCLQRADGNRSVALAELKYQHSGSDADRKALATTKNEAAYAVAYEKCDSLAGNPKDVCTKQAEAVRMKADAEARERNTDAEARDQARNTKRGADYNVAVEKCDALAGDSKDACVATAKAKYKADQND